MELSRSTLHDLAVIIHRLCGLVVGHDKTYLVRHRLEPVVCAFRLVDFEQLLQRLRLGTDHKLNEAIIEAITTKESSFFRDQPLFRAISEHVLPERAALLKTPGSRRHRIRIWSAAAAFGQEPYSLAILVREFLDGAGQGLRESQFSILASDISAEALEIAEAGRYSAAQTARGLTENLLRQHFRTAGNHRIVNDAVRRLVQFRRLNLLQPAANLGAFDLILCRNVLIYFDAATRKKICTGLCEMLHEGGWLALGSAESLYGINAGLEEVRFGRVILYRRRQAGA